MGTKICSKCGEEKKLEEFYRKKSHRNGFHSECKKCTEKVNKRWQKNNMDKVLGLGEFEADGVYSKCKKE